MWLLRRDVVLRGTVVRRRSLHLLVLRILLRLECLLGVLWRCLW